MFEIDRKNLILKRTLIKDSERISVLSPSYNVTEGIILQHGPGLVNECRN